MLRTRAEFPLALFCALSAPASIYAHKGNAIYDMKHTVTLTGTVTKLQFPRH